MNAQFKMWIKDVTVQRLSRCDLLRAIEIISKPCNLPRVEKCDAEILGVHFHPIIPGDQFLFSVRARIRCYIPSTSSFGSHVDNTNDKAI